MALLQVIMHIGPLFKSGSGSELVRGLVAMQGHAMIGSGPDTFSGHIILGVDGISCPVGQNFLGKCVPPKHIGLADRFSSDRV